MDDAAIKKIRAFNRYYTTWLDVMNRDYLRTELSWPEARVLYEIYMYQPVSATELCRNLHLDKGYVSRLVGKFEKSGLLTRELVSGGKGMKKIWLTAEGKKTAAQIDENGNQQMKDKFRCMDREACHRLCRAMEVIEEILRENDQKGGNKDEGRRFDSHI